LEKCGIGGEEGGSCVDNLLANLFADFRDGARARGAFLYFGIRLWPGVSFGSGIRFRWRCYWLGREAVDAAALAVEFVKIFRGLHDSGAAGGVDAVVLFFIVFFAGKVGIVPGGCAEGDFADAGGIENHIVHAGLEAGAMKVAAGGLQSVEDEAGSLGVHVSGDEQARDLHERNLDGVGVLEDGQVDGDGAAAGARIFLAIGMKLDALVVMALVEVTETVAAQGGRSALRAVNLDTLATIWITGHWDSFCSQLSASSCELRAASF
jgi:hypothetical protein